MIKELDGRYSYSSFGSLNMGLVGSSWVPSPSDHELALNSLMRELADEAVQNQGEAGLVLAFFHNLHSYKPGTWLCSTYPARTKLYQR